MIIQRSKWLRTDTAIAIVSIAGIAALAGRSLVQRGLLAPSSSTFVDATLEFMSTDLPIHVSYCIYSALEGREVSGEFRLVPGDPRFDGLTTALSQADLKAVPPDEWSPIRESTRKPSSKLVNWVLSQEQMKGPIVITIYPAGYVGVESPAGSLSRWRARVDLWKILRLMMASDIPQASAGMGEDPIRMDSVDWRRGTLIDRVFDEILHEEWLRVVNESEGAIVTAHGVRRANS